MKSTLAFLITSALLAMPFAASADDAACCATKKVVAKAAGSCSAGGEACASASGPSVTFKVKRSDRAKVAAALQSLNGVTAVDTCSSTKFTTVSFNKEKVCTDSILAAVKSAGGDIQAQRAEFAVADVACGDCASKVTKALAKVKGVSEAHVCPVSKVATVDYNPAKACSETILAALDKAGFKATSVLQ